MTSRTPEQIAQTKSQLLALIDELAVVRGKVTLSSGKEADYYLDLRRITLDYRSAPLVGDVMLDLFEEHGLLNDLDAAGGLTMGADPVGTAIMHASVQRNTPVDAFVVRKQAKEHGMGRRVEGDVKGKRVIAVEDTSTTGGSVLTAVEALREAGANVVAVAVVMDRGTGAKERVEAEGLPYLIALSTADLGLE